MKILRPPPRRRPTARRVPLLTWDMKVVVSDRVTAPRLLPGTAQ